MFYDGERKVENFGRKMCVYIGRILKLIDKEAAVASSD